MKPIGRDSQSTEFLMNIPGNLPKRILSLLEQGNRKEHEQLSALRLECEKFIEHLIVLANITEEDLQNCKSVGDKIRLLDSNNINLLKEGTNYYLNFWYGMGCIGSHHKGISDAKHIRLGHHVDMCHNAMISVLHWYLQEFPPLSQKKSFKEESKKTLDEFKPTDFEGFVNPSKKGMDRILEQNSLVVIHGPSWIGKTSLSCFNLHKLVNTGFLPIIFHERNLISPSILLGEGLNSPNEIQRLSLKDKAGILHKEIVTSIFRGDSCAILFDDPFGHRYFRPHSSPLSYLRISDWVKLSQKDTSLGSIKIILNTPTQFWEAVQNLKDESISPILKENLEWILHPSNSQVSIQKLSLKDYLPEEVMLVGKNVAASLNCKWLRKPEICELLADSIAASCDSFDTLRLFCLETQDSVDEEKILNSAEKYFEKSSELNYKINNLEEDLQVVLVIVYLSEVFEQLSRDYLYSKSNFNKFCDHLKVGSIVSKINLQEKLRKELDYWISFESSADDGNARFPKFRHPDIRASLEVFVREENGNKLASSLLANSDFVHCFSQRTPSIMRWESIYLLCYFAHLLDQETCQSIHDKWFSLPKTEFDFEQTLWAISDNWINIKNSCLEGFSIGALKRIQNDFPSSRRKFIWEILNNWTAMPEDIRELVIRLNGEDKGKEKEITSKVMPAHLISFLGAVLCNYQTLTSHLNKVDSKSTRMCLDFANDFIKELSRVKNLEVAQYTSFEDDRVFENRGVNYSGREVLLRIRKMGVDYGGLAEDEQMVRNIDAVVGAK
jgi:hypothetical protein